MPRTVGIGRQDFEKIISRNNFYIDKTLFIREWWENDDDVTLITRPRRFGKTLTLSMVERFFSIKYANQGDLFKDLAIWQIDDYRTLQGSYPVISLTFANVKETNYQTTREKICQILVNLYTQHNYLLESDVLTEQDRIFFKNITPKMGDMEASMAIHQLSDYLYRYYGKRVIILLDEYDTPMQEAYVCGYWDELASFTRSMFHATFKANPYLERAIMTGITRVSKESVFSDLNNLEVVTTTSFKYESSFGFLEKEVFKALDEYGLSDKKQQVKEWYDGFTFGRCTDVYNPWSILNYLDKQKFSAYWANSSGNALINKLIQEGSPEVKADFEELLLGHVLQKEIDEQIVFGRLKRQESAIWSLLLACGYLKVDSYLLNEQTGKELYSLTLTNKEIRIMFTNMIRSWFSESESTYNYFLKAFLEGNIRAMNQYMNKIALATFSSFDTGNKPSKESEPERFYHGFVLGLIVELNEKYIILSNRESGFGRYDVILEPIRKNLDAMILEFKVFDPAKERSLEDTLIRALTQIEDKQYAVNLIEKGIPENKIRKYGFAFQGKQVLIGDAFTAIDSN